MSSSPADEVLRQCLRAGIREYVVCAGARNSALVLPLLGCDAVRCWNFFEERSAGFFAVGRAMSTGQPVAVVTTSGTAVAELLPAVIEAHYSGRPLVVISADRPASFRGSGAPQAIEQAGIFGGYVEECLDLEGDLASGLLDGWSRLGPVHLNVCLGEGVTGVALDGEVGAPVRAEVPDATAQAEEFVGDGDGVLVMLGELMPEERDGVGGFLSGLEVSVYAEATSGLRELFSTVTGGDEELSGLDVRKVLRIGGVPSCRYWRDLEERPEVSVLSITRSGFRGLARDCEVLQGGVGQRIGAGAAREIGADGAGWMGVLSERVAEGGLVFLGNSLPIREWNAGATWNTRGLRCYANRGANGIDGEVSTFLGLSEGEDESWGIFGDLTTLYDLSAPWVLSQLSEGRRRIVVMNNGGGKIFSRLPVFEGAAPEAMAAIENRHGIGFEAWASLWGMGYRQVERASDLNAELGDGTVVVEVIVE